MTPELLDYHASLMRQVLNGHVGRENAIAVAELAPLVDLGANRDYRDVREVRDHLEDEYQVLSDATGYWKAENPEEVEAVMVSIRRTAMTLLWRYSRLRKLKRRLWPHYQGRLFREAA